MLLAIVRVFLKNTLIGDNDVYVLITWVKLKGCWIVIGCIFTLKASSNWSFLIRLGCALPANKMVQFDSLIDIITTHTQIKHILFVNCHQLMMNVLTPLPSDLMRGTTFSLLIHCNTRGAPYWAPRQDEREDTYKPKRNSTPTRDTLDAIM